jgi:hypothetical protein
MCFSPLSVAAVVGIDVHVSLVVAHVGRNELGRHTSSKWSWEH